MCTGSCELLAYVRAPHCAHRRARPCAQFWDDVAAYNQTFSTPEPEVPNELPPATLRRETVRKAKMGMAARSIFSRYIQPAAPLEIRVDKLMRTELTNRSARSHPSIRRVCDVIIHAQAAPCCSPCHATVLPADPPMQKCLLKPNWS
jgi:hypothetical protein